MTIQITTLSENTAGLGNFLGEWGLSILVETEGLNLLIDCGQSISAVHNADILGIDLSKIDKIILSHGHYDHTGGLRPLLRRMKKRIEIIAHPDGQADHYIGIPYRQNELESLGACFKPGTEPTWITGSMITSGEIPMVTDFEELATNLQVKGAGGFQPDKLLDDQALIIKTEAGLVVILGCAHRGIINTIYHAQQLTGVKKVHAVLGGCHLINAPQERVRLTINALKELGVERLGVSHCTGLPAASTMAQEFGERFFFNVAGTITKLP